MRVWLVLPAVGVTSASTVSVVSGWGGGGTAGLITRYKLFISGLRLLEFLSKVKIGATTFAFT